MTYGTGVFKYDMSRKKLVTYYPLFQSLATGQKYFGSGFDAIYDESGKLWLGGDKGLYYYDERKNNFNYVPYSDAKTKQATMYMNLLVGRKVASGPRHVRRTMRFRL